MSRSRSLFLITATCLIPLTLTPHHTNAADHRGFDRQSCTYNGLPLHGRVQIVDAFPDITVQKRDAFNDLNVQKVDAFPDSCGQFEIVDSFPDIKIQFVDAFPALTIRFVDAFPGVAP